jgi:hypothetical protein
MFMRSYNRPVPRTRCGRQEDHNLQSTQVYRTASQSGDGVSLGDRLPLDKYLILFCLKVTANSVICFRSGRYDRVCSSPCVIPFRYSR